MTENWVDIMRRPEWIPCFLLMCLMYVSFGTGRGGATSLPFDACPVPGLAPRAAAGAGRGETAAAALVAPGFRLCDLEDARTSHYLRLRSTNPRTGHASPGWGGQERRRARVAPAVDLKVTCLDRLGALPLSERLAARSPARLGRGGGLRHFLGRAPLRRRDIRPLALRPARLDTSLEGRLPLGSRVGGSRSPHRAGDLARMGSGATVRRPSFGDASSHGSLSRAVLSERPCCRGLCNRLHSPPRRQLAGRCPLPPRRDGSWIDSCLRRAPLPRRRGGWSTRRSRSSADRVLRWAQSLVADHCRHQSAHGPSRRSRVACARRAETTSPTRVTARTIAR